MAIDARTEALQTLRELGPPDLVHLVKQSAKAALRPVWWLLEVRRALMRGDGTNSTAHTEGIRLLLTS